MFTKIMFARMISGRLLSFAWTFFAIGMLGLVGCDSSTVSHDPIDEAQFAADLSSGELVLVKFGATWCGPCERVNEELVKLGKKNLPVKIVSVDVDANRSLAKKYRVSSIPDMVLIRNDEIIDRKVGYESAADLEKWFQKYSINKSSEPSQIKSSNESKDDVQESQGVI